MNKKSSENQSSDNQEKSQRERFKDGLEEQKSIKEALDFFRSFNKNSISNS